MDTEIHDYGIEQFFGMMDGSGLQGKVGIFLCLEGEADILLNDRVFRITRGIVHVLSPLVFAFPIYKSDDFDGIYIIDKLEVLYPLMRANIETITSLNLMQYPCLQLNCKEMEFLIERKKLIDSKREAMVVAESECEKRLLKQMLHLLMQETILEVLNRYFRNTVVKPNAVSKDRSLIYKFLITLQRDYTRCRSVKYYADKANLSTGRFTAIVKQATGKVPSEWISTVTILNAKMMLEKTDKRIKEIAEELNFPEQFTFRKYFKHHVGMPPKQYRMLHVQQHS